MAGAWEEMIFKVLLIQTILAFSDLRLEAPLAQSQRMPGPKSTHQTDQRRDAHPTGGTPQGFFSPQNKGDIWSGFSLILAGLAISMPKLRREADCAAPLLLLLITTQIISADKAGPNESLLLMGCSRLGVQVPCVPRGLGGC